MGQAKTLIQIDEEIKLILVSKSQIAIEDSYWLRTKIAIHAGFSGFMQVLTLDLNTDTEISPAC